MFGAYQWQQLHSTQREAGPLSLGEISELRPTPSVPSSEYWRPYLHFIIFTMLLLCTVELIMHCYSMVATEFYRQAVQIRKYLSQPLGYGDRLWSSNVGIKLRLPGSHPDIISIRYNAFMPCGRQQMLCFMPHSFTLAFPPRNVKKIKSCVQKTINLVL